MAQKIQSIKFETLYAALKELAGAGLVQGDDELEAWLRKAMGLPEAGAQPRKPVAKPAVAPPAEPAPPGQMAGSAAAPVMVDGVRVGRAVKPVERCLALAAIVGELDRGRDEVAARCGGRGARSRRSWC